MTPRIAVVLGAIAVTHTAVMGGRQPAVQQLVEIRVGFDATTTGTPASPQNMMVLVDGQPRRTVAVAPVSGSASVALIIDRHDSTIANSFESGSPADRRRLADIATKQFISRIETTDRLLVGVVGDKLSMVSTAGDDRKAAGSALTKALDVTDEDWHPAGIPGGARGSGTAPIWDAVSEAVTALTDLPAPRSLVLFSNGEVTGNQRSFDDVLEQAFHASVAVHVISAAVDVVIPQGPQLPPLESHPSLR